MEGHKVDDISCAVFMREFYQPSIPVVFKIGLNARSDDGDLTSCRFLCANGIVLVCPTDNQLHLRQPQLAENLRKEIQSLADISHRYYQI